MYSRGGGGRLPPPSPLDYRYRVEMQVHSPIFLGQRSLKKKFTVNFDSFGAREGGIKWQKKRVGKLKKVIFFCFRQT